MIPKVGGSGEKSTRYSPCLFQEFGASYCPVAGEGGGAVGHMSEPRNIDDRVLDLLSDRRESRNRCLAVCSGSDHSLPNMQDMRREGVKNEKRDRMST